MEGVGAPLVAEANPEGVARAAEHQAVGEGLLEPSGDRENMLRKKSLRDVFSCYESVCVCVGCTYW